MHFWNWFLFATAVVVASRDISTLPECMVSIPVRISSYSSRSDIQKQECMLVENKRFDILEAPKKRICKEYSVKIIKFWKWYSLDLSPCVANQCVDLTNDEAADGKIRPYNQHLDYSHNNTVVYSFH
jgi:hypothetical protein